MGAKSGDSGSKIVPRRVEPSRVESGPRVGSREDRVAAAVAGMVGGASAFLENLVVFARLRGWELYGYRSFGAWAAVEWSLTRSVAYQELAKANAIGRVADLLGVGVGEVVDAVGVLPGVDAARVAGLSDVELLRAVDDGRGDAVSGVPVVVAAAVLRRARVRPVEVSGVDRWTEKLLAVVARFDPVEVPAPSTRARIAGVRDVLSVMLDRWDEGGVDGG